MAWISAPARGEEAGRGGTDRIMGVGWGWGSLELILSGGLSVRSNQYSRWLLQRA